MRWNNRGFTLYNALAVIAVLLIIAAIAIPNLSKKAVPDIELRGWVRNVNIVYNTDTTHIAFEKEGDITPQPYELDGKHPELWPGEHVWLKLHPRPLVTPTRYDVVGFQRLGPDDKSGQLPNSP